MYRILGARQAATIQPSKCFNRRESFTLATTFGTVKVERKPDPWARRDFSAS